nr:E3 ubiquitin-protein ligase AIP2 [Ipomoea batatas]
MRPPSAAPDLLRTGGFIRSKALALGYSSRSTGYGAPELLKRERARRRAGIGSPCRGESGLRDSGSEVHGRWSGATHNNRPVGHNHAMRLRCRKLWICLVAYVCRAFYNILGKKNCYLNVFFVNKSFLSIAKEGDQTGNRITFRKRQLGKKQSFEEAFVIAFSPCLRFLFEGHLTVDPEPPQPDWLVMSNLLSPAATLPDGQSSEENPAISNSSEAAANLLRELADRLDDIVPMILDDAPAAPRVPPASKEVVAKLPVTTVTDEFLAKLDADAECAICKENLVLNDKMQELPCKHMFHPPCLKPWLDEHNSCPICRHELQTDDHNYESWKEREREAEEERKGAANAVREGEYMYV